MPELDIELEDESKLLLQADKTQRIVLLHS